MPIPARTGSFGLRWFRSPRRPTAVVVESDARGLYAGLSGLTFHHQRVCLRVDKGAMRSPRSQSSKVRKDGLRMPTLSSEIPQLGTDSSGSRPPTVSLMIAKFCAAFGRVHRTGTGLLFRCTQCFRSSWLCKFARWLVSSCRHFITLGSIGRAIAIAVSFAVSSAVSTLAAEGGVNSVTIGALGTPHATSTSTFRPTNTYVPTTPTPTNQPIRTPLDPEPGDSGCHMARHEQGRCAIFLIGCFFLVAVRSKSKQARTTGLDLGRIGCVFSRSRWWPR